MANKNSKKKKARSFSIDARTKKAFKITAKVKKSNAEILQEVRAGTHV